MSGFEHLVYDRFDPDAERLREALCTLGNGYFATRGAMEFVEAGPRHYPGTYLAGGYNRLPTEIRGHLVENEDLVNLPNWLPLTFRHEDGDWLDLDAVEILDYRQELDMESGLLSRDMRVRDGQGRETGISMRRLVHIEQRHHAAIEVTLTPGNWSGDIEVRSAIDGRVVNAGVDRYRALDGRHLEWLDGDTADEEVIWLRVRTNQSRREISLAARTRLYRGAERVVGACRPIAQQARVATLHRVRADAGVPLRVEKIVSLFTSRDPAIAESSLAARNAVAEAPEFARLAATQARAWRHLWRVFDTQIEDGDDDPVAWARTRMILRLHVFHLVQTASPATVELDVGVPARGLHGEAYRGHIFWDELFIFPFLDLRMPEITRALLSYRYRRLDAARAAARAHGYRGAMYPWQSGSDGREESQIIHLNPRSGRWLPDHTFLQRHIGSAVAYNVWHYFETTGDIDFMSACGAEMILEIARFWSSIATFGEASGRWEIRGVVGPDEYHTAYPGSDSAGLDNNAYTNVMAVWVLCRALEVLDLLPADRREALCERLEIDEAERTRWDEISRRMRIVFHDDGIVSQFEGYAELEELDWEGYRDRYGDIHRLDRILEAEGDSPNRYKCSKQADVLMLLYLFTADELAALFRRLGYRFEGEMLPRTVEYYLRRTSHGSTLSSVVHSWVLARSDRRRSWELFAEALESDVSDVQGGTTAEGIHLGAMAGTVDLIQRCYTGIETRGGVLRLDPALPEGITRLQLRIHYRGSALRVSIGDGRVEVSAGESGAREVRVALRDREFTLRPGGTVAADLRLKEK